MKSPLLHGHLPSHVHLRLRKRLARCTLDCGFKTSESPALRGFVGEPRTLATAALYLVLKSNGLPLEKPSCKVRFFVQNRSRKYRQKVTATTLFQTAFHRIFQLLAQTAHVRFHGRKRVHTRLSEKDRTQRLTRRNRGLPSLDHSAALCRQRNTLISATLLYTYISRFSVDPTPAESQAAAIIPNRFSSCVFNFSHKRPTFAFTAKAGTHSARLKESHTRAHTAKQWAFQMGVLSLPSARSARSRNIPGSGIRTANFAALGSWPGVRPKNAESLRDSDALMRVAVPRRRGPAGLRDLFLLSKLWLVCHALRVFPRVRDMGGITTLGALCVLLKHSAPACQSDSFVIF